MSDQCFGIKTRRARARSLATRLALLAGCLGALALPGCSRSPGEQALNDASIKLASLDVGVGSQMPEGVSKKTFNEVIQTLTEFSKGEGALAADASVLISSAQRGLGTQTAAHAASLERQALDKLPGLRARLRAWQMYNAAAAAAGSYDPAPEFARIDQDTRARQGEAEQARAKKAAIEKQISELLAQVTDRIAKASGLRDQAGGMQLRIAGVSATEGLVLSEKIRELTREADKLEFEARNLKNQADRLEVDLRAAAVDIEKLTSQIELLGQSRAAVQARDKAAKEDAAGARGDAQQAAVQVGEFVDSGDGALTPFRTDQVDAAHEQAVQQLQSAIASAKRGTTSRRANAQMAIGQTQQSLADDQWTRALGLDAYAQVLEELAGAKPALPSAAEYAARASEARTQATEAKQAAFDAYQAAKSAYESTGASGRARELLDQVSTRLNEISRQVGKGVVDAEALSTLSEPEPAEPAANEPGDRRAAADDVVPTDPTEEVRGALQAMMDSVTAGTYGDLSDMIAPATDADATVIGQLGGILAAQERLDSTTRSAFGQSFTEWSLANAQGAAQAMNPADMFGVEAANADIRVQGDEAIVMTGNAANAELHFRRIDGVWKLVLSMADFSGGAAQVPEQMRGILTAMMPEILTATTQAYGAAADGVDDGSLRSNQAVAVTIQTKLQALNVKIMQKLQEAGGGGG